MVTSPSPRHLVLVGATASGKSAAALEMARRDPSFEIMSIDSMAVYRGMDIGTDKPTAHDRAEVAYHLLDLADPSEDYSVTAFQCEAKRVLADIESRGCRALLVGGTGLYVRAVVDDLSIPGRWPELAEELAAVADAGRLPELHVRLAELDPVSATRMEPTNRRRVLRALEVTIGSGRPFSSFGPGLELYPPTPFDLIGLHIDRARQNHRISARLRRQLDMGFVEEVRTLASRPAGMSRTARQAAGYRELLSHVEGGRPLDQAVEDADRRIRRLARRQRSWFGRDPRVRWVDASDDVISAVAHELGQDLACRS